jgi:hypothetical protein
MPGDGRLELSWRPGPWIGYEQVPSRLIPGVANAAGGRVVVWGTGANARYASSGLAISFGSSGRPRTRLFGYLPEGIEVVRSRQLAALDFHLVNFPGLCRRTCRARWWMAILASLVSRPGLERGSGLGRGL